MSTSNEVPEPFAGRPHLVILGAGASRAALPNGDRFGRQIPLLADLPDILQLDGILNEHGIDLNGRDFEELYSDLHSADPENPLLSELEDAVRNYFASLKLPPEPTIYDYLILSLRNKDFIATFNWDPFLFQAASRNRMAGPQPLLAFLHGCAILGVCDEHMWKGAIQGSCSECGRPYRPSRLLFPVKDKDYDVDAHISGEWSGFEAALREAYILTIFGFGAPSTDAKAVEIMESAWKSTGKRELEETEIIDIKRRNELKEKWDPFIVRAHYRTYHEFTGSTIARFPRRSCEVIWNQFMMLKVPHDNPAPVDVSLPDLQDWFQQLITGEQVTDT